MLLVRAMLGNGDTYYGLAGNLARCVIALVLMLVLNVAADLIVDLGSAKDFMFLDIGRNPSRDAFLANGQFNGDIGWSGGIGTGLNLARSTLDGDIYRSSGSYLGVRRGGHLLGSDHPAVDMSNFIEDVDAAVARFGIFSQDMDLGNVFQHGDFTIDRTDKYTVVDIDSLKLFNGTLTLNGQPDDIFYIRINNAFDLFNVDVNIVGTDPSRVFFIYGGMNALKYKHGAFRGNIVAPNAKVFLSKIEGFDGSMVSGDGLFVEGKDSHVVFEYTKAIPEPAVAGMIGLFAGGVLFLRRIFWNKVVKATA